MAENSLMNAAEKNRIDQAEQAIVGLSGRMDGFDARLEAVEADTSETKKGVQVLLARTGGMEATRGMVPVTSILAAGALLLTLVGIGLKIQYDSEAKHDAKIQTIIDLQNARHSTVDALFEAIDSRLTETANGLGGSREQLIRLMVSGENVATRIEQLESMLEETATKSELDQLLGSNKP